MKRFSQPVVSSRTPLIILSGQDVIRCCAWCLSVGACLHEYMNEHSQLS